MFLPKPTLNNVQQRLSRLIKARDKELVSPTNSDSELLTNPPEYAVRPLIRGAALFVLCLLALWWLNRPTEISEVINSISSNSQASTADPLGELVVHVTGEVKNPGVVKLPAGSRVIDAITAAGGLITEKEFGNLNLAALVEDGELIYVGNESSNQTDGRLNLNTATSAQLEELPGVGPVMAARILAWRETHNRFSDVDELQEIEGIDPKLFGRIRELVRV